MGVAISDAARFSAFVERIPTKKKGRRKAVPSSPTTPTRRFIQAKSLRRSRAVNLFATAHR